MTTLIPSPLRAAVLLGASLSLTACGGGSGDTPSTVDLDTGSASRSNEVVGPLDPLQDRLITDIVGTQLGGTLPAPLGPTVQCAADAINSLVDGPDALLAALSNANGQPTVALNGAAQELIAAVTRFATDLQSTLGSLVGNTACDSAAARGEALPAMEGNPFVGTPLAPIGSALTELLGVLSGLGGQNDGDDPNLTGVTDALTPVLAQLSSAFDMVPAEVRDAPVLGGLLTTLQGVTGDLANTLPEAGNYNAAATNAGLETLLNNLLGNVLLQVLPVAAIDERTGQDFSGQIQAGIDTATNTLGAVTGQLITPLFDQVLNGVASPLLNPIESLLAQLLGNVPVLGGGEATGNPLTGLLGGVAGDGASSPLDGLLALLTTGVDGSPLSAVTGPLGSNANTAPLGQLTALGNGGLALDSLLAQLKDATAGIPLVGGLVGTVVDLLGGLLGGGRG